MRFAYYVGKLVWESFRFSLVTRRYSIVLLIIVGLLLVAIVLAAQAAAPVALYPFA